MKKLAIVAAVALVAVLVFKQASGTAETAADLPGITFAASVPIFPGAEYADRTGGEHSRRAGEWHRYETWMFTLPAPRSEVVSFYDRHYPNAERDESDGNVSYEIDPDGTGKRAQIRVYEGELEITEYRD